MTEPVTPLGVGSTDTQRAPAITGRYAAGRSPQASIEIGALADPLPFRRTAGATSAIALAATDVMVLLLTGYGVRALRAALLGSMPLTPAFVATGVLWVGLRAYSGLYPGFGVHGPEELRRSTASTGLAALAHSALLFAIHMATASRFIAVGTWLLLIPISWAGREIVKAALIRLRLYGRPVVILGGGAIGRLLIQELRENPGLGLVPVAVFDDDVLLQGQRIEGVPVIGPLGRAHEWRYSYPECEAIFTASDQSEHRLAQLIQSVSRQFAHVSVVADTFGLGALWARSQVIGTYTTLQVHNDRFNRANLLLKRVFDLLVGIPLFLASLPTITMAALLVKVFSPGPAFYGQKREGRDGKRFRVWKIRTMVPDAERRLEQVLEGDRTARLQWEQRMKLDRDPRVVPRVGHFLRRTSIDELPQLWNVICGDMSLVGPRPFPNYHLRRFSQEFRELRHQVPPGITGYWQITHRSAADLHAQQATDSYYIHNWSLWLDLWILFRTVRVVVNGSGAR
jgi:Undecaprenyl-phosphate galactose phosphotransferase WbaP